MDKIKIDYIYLFTSFTVGFDYWLWEKKTGFESSRHFPLNSL